MIDDTGFCLHSQNSDQKGDTGSVCTGLVGGVLEKCKGPKNSRGECEQDQKNA